MMNLMRRINKQALIASLCYILLITLCAYLLLSGKYLEFVVPRIMIFLWFMITLLVLITLRHLKELFNPKYHNNYRPFLPVLLLFLMILFVKNQDMAKIQMELLAQNSPKVIKTIPVSKNGLLKNKELGITHDLSEIKIENRLHVGANNNDFSSANSIPNSNNINGKSLGGTTLIPDVSKLKGTVDENKAKAITKRAQSAAKSTIAQAMKVQDETSKNGSKANNSPAATIDPQTGELGVNDSVSDIDDDLYGNFDVSNQISVAKEKAPPEKLTLTTSNYFDQMVMISSNLDKYVGDEISFDGFIMRDKTLYDVGDFMVVRMAMTCCIADITPLGMVCFYDGDDVPNGAWVHVEGVIRKTSFHGMSQIGVNITKIRRITPISGYIYP